MEPAEWSVRWPRLFLDLKFWPISPTVFIYSNNFQITFALFRFPAACVRLMAAISEVFDSKLIL